MMIKRMRSIFRCLLVAWLLGAQAVLAGAIDGTLQRARTMLEQGKATAAYQLLAAEESKYSGHPDFDYLLGVTALESGQPGRAVFALERVLAVSPRHTLARAEIARAYFQLGEQRTARQEFSNVLNENPPEPVNKTISQYLSAIDQAMSDRTRFSAYLELAMGHDSNVNRATSSNAVDLNVRGIGALPGFPLPSDATRHTDNFTQFGGGVGFRHPLTSSLDLFGGVSGYQHANFKADQYNTSAIDANLGVSLHRQHDLYSMAIQSNDFSLDSNGYRRSFGVTGQWQHTLDNSNQISAFLQASRLDYMTQPNRDADRYVAGVGYGHAFSGRYLPVVYLGAYVGKENERESGLPWLGYDLAGVRAGGQITYNARTAIYGSASLEHRDYGGEEPLFSVSRTDRQWDAALGLKYTPVELWTIQPQLTYTRNSSNVEIDDYNRYSFSVTLHRDFSW